MKFAHLVDVNDFVNWCDYLGTLAFAVSGIRLAAGKGLDWFGAYVVGFVTAVGGGTIRDILLDIKPFWLVQPSYLIITALGLIFTIIFRRQVVRLNHSLFVFDAIGLGLFVVVGVAKSYAAGFPWWVAVIMGTVTGSFGGLLRDVLINETPLIFRTDFYASACVLGSIIYVLMGRYSSLPIEWVQFISAISVFVFRVLAVVLHIQLPTFNPKLTEKSEQEKGVS
ncbi:MAG: trimeric intracellular cation channel family protein [Porphyromonas sp.]|jgi:protein Yads|uniref:trimeric intracellular cation channel family protein n=1 Tax=Porphyromonas sp. TaxID=1924944 RepID=UPI001CB29786|nr:trimeric intracellular cation channel family protein [Porphyromonas sp.]MBF1289498.1 trimeric intracellular cation channel family protein [Porphyromonadaceae bacterium]MBF1316965.1 trimeric intracellular cation channel family protein [Porphyromonadaceae bacterium]MBF1364422.1 trimeric intracellular cation channel family protein [Porphyromonadaceae bacterium]MBF1370176.1 trimeric intracellular cation channel family protein [Porphyromonas sp.]MBF1374719.1 trimeric intracellular cation channel